MRADKLVQSSRDCFLNRGLLGGIDGSELGCSAERLRCQLVAISLALNPSAGEEALSSFLELNQLYLISRKGEQNGKSAWLQQKAGFTPELIHRPHSF